MAYKLIVDQAGVLGYVGKAERCTFEFSTLPEQIPGESWLAQQIVNRGIAELQAQGSSLLWIKLWRDTAPTWQTDYRVEVTATASPLWWTAIILGVLAVLALIISWRIVETVTDIDWGKAALPIAIGGISLALLAIIGIILLAGGKK